MRQVVVRSRLKPEEAAHHEERARQEFAELGRIAPSGIHWAMCALEDGVTFIAVATTETMDDGRSRRWEIEAFRAFQEQAGQLWKAPPQVEVLREGGSYGFLAEAKIR